MGYSLTSLVGSNPPGTVSTVREWPLGQVAQGRDAATQEAAEFVYLKGVASTVAGDVVVYDTRAGTTTRATAGSRGPVAVAMGATVADTYGWYQISGAAVVKAGTVAAGAPAFATATAGTVDDANVAGDKIDGMVFKTADGTPSAGFAVAQLSRPSMNGNDRIE